MGSTQSVIIVLDNWEAKVVGWGPTPVYRAPPVGFTFSWGFYECVPLFFFFFFFFLFVFFLSFFCARDLSQDFSRSLFSPSLSPPKT